MRVTLPPRAQSVPSSSGSRGLKGALSRGPLSSQAGAKAGLRGQVTVLSFPSGDFLARSIDIVTDEGQYFGICTRLVLLTGLMSVDHHQNPSLSIKNKAGCLLPLLPNSLWELGQRASVPWASMVSTS